MIKSILFLAFVAVAALACAGPRTNNKASNATMPDSAAPRNAAPNAPAQATAPSPAPSVAQAPPAAPGAIPFPDSPRIPLDQAKADFDRGTAVFIDTHNSNTFAAEHVRGALNIAPNDLDAKINLIPKGKKIIVYCS